MPGSRSRRLKKHSQVYHRVQSTRDTWRWASTIAERCGVTRVGGITGLDRLGVPVYQSYRPNARSISVSAGKGIDAFAAKTSALMEAIELHCAERIEPGAQRFRYCDASGSSRPILDPGPLALPEHVEEVRQIPLFWLDGFDLFTQLTDALADPEHRTGGIGVSVPYDAVHCRFDMDTLATTPAGLFRTSSNGLASGVTRAEAICHGLCEVIERHSVIAWMDSGDARLTESKVRLDTIRDSDVRGLLQRLHDREVDVALWDVSGALGVPVFRCALCDRSPDGFYTLMPALGAGCHPTRGYAMLRAITEAAQARLTLISGAREDISHAIYRAGHDLDAWRAQRREIVETEAGRDACDTPSFLSEYIEDDIAWLLERVRAGDAPDVVAVDLTREEVGVPVMRVVAPGFRAPTPRGQRGHADDAGGH